MPVCLFLKPKGLLPIFPFSVESLFEYQDLVNLINPQKVIYILPYHTWERLNRINRIKRIQTIRICFLSWENK